ncbi:hypothetical protein IWX90DRAFT_422466 [Phyllosticta citrichinensis]|uniref:Secreted protein n=1 Tax=Phyllosticta citrichinensis TaxID=1130410 RepID=A0ABR1Y7X3_9PEZI
MIPPRPASIISLFFTFLLPFLLPLPFRPSFPFSASSFCFLRAAASSISSSSITAFAYARLAASYAARASTYAALTAWSSGAAHRARRAAS